MLDSCWKTGLEDFDFLFGPLRGKDGCRRHVAQGAIAGHDAQADQHLDRAWIGVLQHLDGRHIIARVLVRIDAFALRVSRIAPQRQQSETDKCRL